MDVAELAFKIDSKDILTAEKELDKLSTAADKVGTGSVKSGGLIKQSMGSITTETAKAEKSTSSLGKGLAKLGTFVTVAAFVGFAKGAVEMGIAFDTSMNNVDAKLQGTAEEMDKLRTVAKDLGKSTAFSASEAADGMGFLAQAGLDTNEIIQAMPEVMNLASAAQMDLSTAADLSTNAMGSFGLKVKDLPDIVDLLAATSAKANTNVAELSAGITEVGPVAAGFGVSMADTSAALGLLANNGIKGGKAGMVLKNMFIQLQNPVGQAAEAMDKLNIDTDDFYTTMDDGKVVFKGFDEMMKVLQETGADTGDIINLFGREAGPGMQVLLSEGRGAFADLRTDIEDVGFAAEAAAKQTEGLPGAFKKMKSAWEGVNLAFMELGGTTLATKAVNLVTEALGLMTDGIEALDKWLDDTGRKWDAFKKKLEFSDDKTYVVLRDIGDAIEKVYEFIKPALPYIGEFAGALVAIGATYLTIGYLGGAIKTVVTAAKGIALIASLNPVTIALVAIGGAAVVIYKNWDKITEWWKGIWESIQDTIEKFSKKWDDFVEKIKNVTDMFPSLSDVKQQGAEMVDGAVAVAKDTLSGFGNALKGGFASIFGAGSAVGDAAIEGMRSEQGTDSHSDSRKAIAIGHDVYKGLISGLESGTVAVREAAATLSEDAMRGFDRLMQGLEQQRILLEEGEEPARRFALELEHITGSYQDTVVEQETYIGNLKLEKEAREKVLAEIDAQTKAQYLQNIELTEGSGAALAASKEMDQYTDAQIANYIATGENMDLQKEFYEALVKSIGDAKSIKDVVNDLGNWLKDWLEEKIVHFAARQITLVFGESGLGDIMSTVSSFLNGGASGGDLLTSIKNIFSGGSNVAAATQGAGVVAQGAGAVSTGITAAEAAAGAGAYGAATAGTAGTAAAVTANGTPIVAGGVGGVTAAEAAAGAGGYTAASTGSMTASAFVANLIPPLAVAAAIVGAMKWAQRGQWEQHASGFNVGIEDGNIVGENVEYWSADKNFGRGSNRTSREGRLDSDVRNQIADYMVDLESTLRDSFSNLNLELPDSVMATLNLDELQVYIKTGDDGGHVAEQMTAWLEEMSVQAITNAFNEMPSDLQNLLVDKYDFLNQTAEDMIGILNTIGEKFTTVSSAAEILNLNFDPLEVGAYGASDALIELFGSLDAFRTATQLYYNEYYTEGERQAISLANNARLLSDFNDKLADLGLEAVTSREGMMNVIENLDLMGAEGRALLPMALDASIAFAELEKSGMSMGEIIAALPTHMQVKFQDLNNITTTAAEDLVKIWDKSNTELLNAAELGGGSLIGAMQSTFATVVNDGTLSGAELVSALDTAFTQVMTDAGIIKEDLPEELQIGYAAMLGNAAVAAEALRISTGEGTGYLETMGIAIVDASVDASSAVGIMQSEMHNSMFTLVDDAGLAGTGLVEKLKLAFDKTLQNTDATGTELIKLLDVAFKQVLTDAGLTADNLPPELQSGYDQMIGDAVNTANAIRTQSIDTAKSLSQVTGAVNSLGGAASSNIGTLNSLTGAVSSSTGAVIGVISKFNSVINSGSLGVAQINSNADGLPYVPYDGYNTDLHLGERVLTAKEAAEYPRLLSFAANQNSYNSPVRINNRNSDTTPVVNELKKVLKEVEQLRKENASVGLESVNGIRAMVNGSNKQVDEMQQMQKATTRLARKMESQ